MDEFLKSTTQVKLDDLNSKKYILKDEYESICNECKEKILEIKSKKKKLQVRKNKIMNEFYKRRNCLFLMNVGAIIIFFVTCNSLLLDFDIAIKTSLAAALATSIVIDIPIYLYCLKFQYYNNLEYIANLENEILILELEKENYKKMMDKARSLYYDSFIQENISEDKFIKTENYKICEEGATVVFKPLTRKLEKK